MSYQNSNPNIYNGAPATTTTGKKPMTHWWPIGIFLCSVLFFVTGGGLLGAWASSATCSYSDYSDYSYYSYAYNCDGNRSMFYAGVAMVVIGAILKFAFWVLLIIWCVQRRRSRSTSTVVYVNAQANAENGNGFADKPQQYGGSGAVYGAPQANYTGVPQQEFPASTEYSGINPAPVYGSAAATNMGDKQTVTRYCGQCGTGTTTGYCTRCGTQVSMS